MNESCAATGRSPRWESPRWFPQTKQIPGKTNPRFQKKLQNLGEFFSLWVRCINVFYIIYIYDIYIYMYSWLFSKWWMVQPSVKLWVLPSRRRMLLAEKSYQNDLLCTGWVESWMLVDGEWTDAFNYVSLRILPRILVWMITWSTFALPQLPFFNPQLRELK